MTPAARIAAAIELLSKIEEAIAGSGLPADRIIQAYFRDRRYAGSKDRRIITALIYDVLRNRELVMWTADKISLANIPRSYLFTWLYLSNHEYKDLIVAEHPYGSEPANSSELRKLALIAELDQNEAPESVTLNIPDWAFEGARERFGNNLAQQAAALNQEAGLTLRSNPLKVRDKSSETKLVSDLNRFEKTRFSNLGYQSVERVNISQTKSFKDGLIEVQDEAAQIACLLVNAQENDTVIDLCAGAGGKSLLMSATMSNKGNIYGFDIVERRLKELNKRAKRAGVKNIRTDVLPIEAGARANKLRKFEGAADKVVLDVPCTGSGTWRRSPDLRRRYNQNSLADLNKTQKNLLAEGGSLTKVGGRVFYMTCSILPAENESVVQAFLEEHAGWKLLNYKDNWKSRYLSDNAPDSDTVVSRCLQLTSHSHGTDGFFIAILERIA